MQVGGGPVKKQASCLVFPAFGIRKSSVVAFQWPNGKFEIPVKLKKCMNVFQQAKHGHVGFILTCYLEVCRNGR